MTDRELLELAAKAAGKELHHWSKSGKFISVPEGYDDHGLAFDPLEDDGDAFRLAAKLYLWEPIRMAHRLVGGDDSPDIYAATRRAVVMAAAEIGKAMP